MKGPPPLSIELGPSRLAGAFILAAYLGTATLVALLPCATVYRALAVMAIGAHGLWTLRSWALRATPSAIVRIEVAPYGQVAFCERSGRRCEGRLQPASYVGTWLTTLVVRIGVSRRARSLALLPDMLEAEEMRQLRVLLRLGGRRHV